MENIITQLISKECIIKCDISLNHLMDEYIDIHVDAKAINQNEWSDLIDILKGYPYKIKITKE
jgi:hypothetical protein